MTDDELLAKLTDTHLVYVRATLYSALRAMMKVFQPVAAHFKGNGWGKST